MIARTPLWLRALEARSSDPALTEAAEAWPPVVPRTRLGSKREAARKATDS